MVLQVKSLKQGWSRRGLADLTTSVLLILGPFLTFLQYHGYPVFTPEAILVSLLLVAAAVPLFLMLRKGGRLRVAGFFLAMYVFVDLQFNVEQYVSFWFVPVTLAVLAFVLRDHLASVLAVAGSVFYLTAFALPTRKNVVRLRVPVQAVSADTSLPPVFHLVFDALTGIGPWQTAPGQPNPGLDSLESVLSRHGFLLFRNV